MDDQGAYDAPAGAGIQVADDAERQRFVVTVDGRAAGHLQYRLRPPNLVLAHTEVDPGFEGRGLGGELVRTALDAARERGLHVDNMCPFVAAWIERHPAYAQLGPGNGSAGATAARDAR